jgi:hypothetical protein
MFNDRHPHAAEHADAYRASEPTRQRDPFTAPTLQVALASETERRAKHQRSGRLGQIVGLFISAPRAGLASAALSLAVLLVALPTGGGLRMGDGGESALQAPLSVASTPAAGAASPEGSTEAPSADEKVADPFEAAEPLDEAGGLPWLTIVGGAGLLVSLLLMERTRRRRRA